MTEKLDKKTIHTWTAKHGWLLLGAAKTPDGYPQENYITPDGNILIFVYDNEDFFRGVGTPAPPPAQSVSQGRIMPPGFPGGLPGMPPMNRG